MADAKKCDRCGSYYDDGSSKDKSFKVNGETVYQIALINSSDRRICEYDLCDQCTRDLFHWMCNEEVDISELEEDASEPCSDKYIERTR